MRKSAKPNILLFLTDDHAAWALHCAGTDEIRSPNLDRLARQGVHFINAFTPCPVCSPARACLNTGRTPSQTGIHDYLRYPNPGHENGDWLAEDEITLPELFAANGFHTMHCGKRHLGNDHLKPRGVERYFGLLKGAARHNGSLPYVLDGAERVIEGNKSTVLTDQAIQFLRERPGDRPFFLNVGFTATHSPYVSAAHDRRVTQLYREATFPAMPDCPPHPWFRNEGMPRDQIPSPEAVRDMRIGYCAAVTEIDREIGRLLDYLKATDALDNTLVVYTSDHGCSLGHHGFWGKGNSTRPLNMYDVSLRIPLIMRWPDKLATNHRELRCVDHYDTFQSLLDWAGIDAPQGRNYPGRSFRTLAEGGVIADWDDTRYGEYGDLRMLRTPEVKWVKRYPDGPHELYDLSNDPGETLNRAGWDAWWPQQQEIDGKLEQWYCSHEVAEKSGLRVKSLPVHNPNEAWRDGIRERRGLQVYPTATPPSPA